MKFTHPSRSAVSVTAGDAQYPVVDGVIDCPPELGAAQGWPAHVEEEPVSILVAPVAKVTAAIAALTSVDELGALQAAETAGKNRKGVLDAIDARLEDLSA